MKEKIYKYKKVAGISFRFTYDLNPITNDYEPHIWIRHCVEPEKAILAWLSTSTQTYNEEYERYEAYSEKYNLEIYYGFSRDKKSVYIFTATEPR